MAHRRDHHLVNEKAHHDRRRTQEDVIDKAHYGGEHIVAAIFGHISAGQDSDRRADGHGQDGEDQTADNRIEETAGGAGRRGHFGENRQRQAREALPQ